MKQKIFTFLMFTGNAKAAMDFYTTVFRPAAVNSIKYYTADSAGPEGTVMQGVFSIKGQDFMCTDSPVQHAFSFTPAISIFVKLDTEDEINSVFKQLCTGGQVMMPLAAYPFSPKFAWVADRFGVSWQISL